MDLGSNLRPISVACSLLLGAVQGKDEADRDVKQREWIWEFFLKNNSNARLLLELMNALPFPNENLYLKRLLLLRSLSLQLSSGLFDELTLDILMALEETGGEFEGLRAAVDCSEAPRPPAKKRRVLEEENNTRISNPESLKAAVKRGLPESLVGRKLSRSRKGVGGGGEGEGEIPDNDRKAKVFPGGDPTDLGDGGTRKEFSYLQCRGPHWELQLAIIVELTVKHLRGVSVSRKAFEGALRRYWGDFIMDTEEPVAERLDFDKAREEIRNELWKVHSNLDLLDEITCKYNEERVRDMLGSFLEKAWAETQDSFLEKVSSDVVHGVYEPLNPDVRRRSVRGVVGEDGLPVNRRELSSEKPFVRSSRGKFSRSREKLQKTFGVCAINARRELGNEERVGQECLTGSGTNEVSTEAVRTCKFSDILVPPMPQARTGEELLRTSRSTSHGSGKKGSVMSGSKDVDRATSEDDEFNHEETGRSQPQKIQFRDKACADEAEDGRVSEEGTTCDPLAEVQRNGSTSPSSPNTRGNMDSSLGDLRRGKGLGNRDQELSEDAEDRPPKSDRAVVETVDISSPSPQPLAQIQGCLSPPPWVASGLRIRKELASERIKSRTGGLVEVDAGNTTAEVSSGAENPVESSGPDSAERSRKGRNLQTGPDVVVQGSSPKIQVTSQGQHRFMRRNCTARTLEWDDEDGISESPPSLTGSKRSPLNINCSTSSGASLQRRKPRKWSTEETELLKNEVFKYGKGRWKLILANNLTIFHGRTQVDLKDKWRNLERSEGLSVRDE